MIPTIWDDVRHTNGVDYHLNWQKQSPEALVKWVQVAGLLVQVGGLLVQVGGLLLLLMEEIQLTSRGL